jgi:hypothetical protein
MKGEKGFYRFYACLWEQPPQLQPLVETKSLRGTAFGQPRLFQAVSHAQRDDHVRAICIDVGACNRDFIASTIPGHGISLSWFTEPPLISKLHENH